MRPFSKGVAFGFGIAIMKLALLYTFFLYGTEREHAALLEQAHFNTITTEFPLLIVITVFLGRAKYWRMMKIMGGMMLTLIIILWPAYMAAFSMHHAY